MTLNKLNLKYSHACSSVIAALIFVQLFSLGLREHSKTVELNIPKKVPPQSQRYSNESININTESSPLNSVTSQGKPLILTLGLRRQFDDIISAHAYAPERMAETLQKLASTMMLTLTSQQKLFELFSRYLSYREQLTQMKNSQSFPDESADITALFHLQRQIIRLQHSLFSEQEIFAFFSQENRYNEQAVERMAIRRDNSLSKEEKLQAIVVQVSQLSEFERQSIEPSLNMQRIAQALEQGKPLPIRIVDTNDVHERFVQLQAQKRHWSGKVKTYRALLADTQLTQQTPQEAAASEQALKAYLYGAFTANERKRLKVFLANPDLL